MKIAKVIKLRLNSVVSYGFWVVSYGLKTNNLQRRTQNAIQLTTLDKVVQPPTFFVTLYHASFIRAS